MFNDTIKPKIGIIGAGNLGTALAVNLSCAGYMIAGISSLHYSSAKQAARVVPGAWTFEHNQGVADVAELVFITTPDSAIEQVAGSINWKRRQMAVHTSGSCSLQPLTPAARAGGLTGVFHPLQTVTGGRNTVFSGITFTVEADEPLRGILKRAALDLGATGIDFTFGSRALYHTSAVMVSNYTVTLFDIAVRLWLQAGYSSEEAASALLPLLEGTLFNLKDTGLPGALTGPVSRGDAGTVSTQIDVLYDSDPSLCKTYKDLGAHTVKVALEKGTIDKPKAQILLDLFDKGASHDQNHAKK